jgi:beta-lactamase regulating signal transducer with metallopeptidase domain
VALATAWQELMPLLDRPSLSIEPPPKQLVRNARSLRGWARCRVGLASTDEVRLATSGFPWSPRLIVSRGASERLTDEQLGAVLRHEHAHWTGRRWWATHLLYAARLLQPFNPVALGCFREYTVELEIDCDEDATRGGGRRTLAGVLLQIYESTDPGDVAARSTLRRRVEALLGDVPRSNDAIPRSALIFALSALAVVLPWLV